MNTRAIRAPDPAPQPFPTLTVRYERGIFADAGAIASVGRGNPGTRRQSADDHAGAIFASAYGRPLWREGRDIRPKGSNKRACTVFRFPTSRRQRGRGKHHWWRSTPTRSFPMVHTISERADARPLSLEDLNTTINHEPRVSHLRIAELLGTRQQETARLIERNRTELEGYGEVCVTLTQTSAKGGRPGREYWLTEGQALVVCALSRTPVAAAVRRALIEAFLAYRRGQLALPAPEQPALSAPEKPVAVKAHRRARPSTTPGVEIEEMPAPFCPGSDFVRDMIAHLKTAIWRMEEGQAADPLAALLQVFEDRRDRNDGKPSTRPILEWNWRRAGAGNVVQLKAARWPTHPHIWERIAAPGEILQIDTRGKGERLPDGSLAMPVVGGGYRIFLKEGGA